MSILQFVLVALFFIHWNIAVAFGISNSTKSQQLQPKLCVKMENYNSAITINEKVNLKILKYKSCPSGKIFKCSKYVTEIMNVAKNDTIEKVRSIPACCDGFYETKDGEKCLRICSDDCQRGECHGCEENCDCIPMLNELPLISECESEYWGPSCENRCECGSHAQGSRSTICDKRTGECGECRPGWIGSQCNMECSPGFYGSKCKEECKCAKWGICDHVTGECNCTAEWSGLLCDVPLATNNRIISQSQDGISTNGNYTNQAYTYHSHSNTGNTINIVTVIFVISMM